MIDISKLTHDEKVKMSFDTSLDSDIKEKIETYLRETKSKIDNLEFIDKIGLKLENNINGQVLTRNAAGKRVDFLAVFIGFLSIPILGLALGLFLHTIFYTEWTFLNLIPSAILAVLGGILLALFLQGWSRRFMFAGFSFAKNSSNFKLRQMSSFTIEETVFNLDSTVSIIQSGEKAFVVLTENGEEHALFALPKLSTIQNETLHALIGKFN